MLLSLTKWERDRDIDCAVSLVNSAGLQFFQLCVTDCVMYLWHIPRDSVALEREMGGHFACACVRLVSTPFYQSRHVDKCSVLCLIAYHIHKLRFHLIGLPLRCWSRVLHALPVAESKLANHRKNTNPNRRKARVLTWSISRQLKGWDAAAPMMASGISMPVPWLMISRSISLKLKMLSDLMLLVLE